MPIQKVEHYACPICKCRSLLVSVRTSYADVLPFKGEEVKESALTAFTCAKCGRTFFQASLKKVGEYDPAERLEEALKPKA